jgi:hypothetical protein
MSNLQFSDGVTINTGGPLRLNYLSDGLYVVGEGMCIPCSDSTEALSIIENKKIMSKSEDPQILCFSEEFIDLFMKAVENAEKRTNIINESIFKKNEREVMVYDTRAQFLINVGIEYEKLIIGILNRGSNQKINL